MMSVEAILSQLVVETLDEDIPSEARQPAIRHLFDCVGVTLAAASHPAGKALAYVAHEVGGGDQARVLGSGLRTSAIQAGWVNGSLAHLLDYDDTGFSHPTACLMPVGLAVAEWIGAGGRELVAAMILGYEVFERLASIARKHEPVLRQRGIHPTSVWGAPAAAATAGRLLRLNQDQMVVALGIAAGSAFGLTQQFGSWSKGLAAGNAARAGVNAAVLAKADYQGDELGITGPYGLLRALVGEGNYDLSSIENDLGQRWSIAQPGLSIKPYPACTSTLRGVDAMLEIASRHPYQSEDIEQINVHIHPDLLHTLRFRSPMSEFQGKFSLEYTVAAAALDRNLTMESFSDAASTRPDFRAMLAKVDLHLHNEWGISRRYDTVVVVKLASGQILDNSVPVHKGSASWPLTPKEVIDKYLTCAEKTLSSDQAQRSVQAIMSIEDALDIGNVVDVLVIDQSPDPDALEEVTLTSL